MAGKGIQIAYKSVAEKSRIVAAEKQLLDLAHQIG